MGYSEGESRVLRRFAEKCHIAGGPQAGYALRRQVLEYGLTPEGRSAAAGGVEALIEKGLLVGNESGDRLILTAAGVEALASGAAASQSGG